MARDYTPVTDYFNGGRVKKMCQDLVRDAKQERDFLLDAKAMFETMLEANSADAVAKTQLVNVLKLLQTSHTKTKDALDTVLKVETLKAKIDQTKPISKDIDDKDLFNLIKRMDGDAK